MREFGQRLVSNVSRTQVGIVASSIVILTTLFLQGIAAFGIQFGPIEKQPFLWPFLNYPMYGSARLEGDEINFETLIGILPDSTEVLIEPDDFSMPFFLFRKQVLAAIRREDRVELQQHRAFYESRHDRQLIGFRLENRPLMVTREGLVEGPRTVLHTISFAPDGDLP